MMSRLLLASLLVPSLVMAAPKAAPHSKPAKPGKAVVATKVTEVEGLTEYSLPNGLRVLLFPDGSKPTVTVNVTYFVGSRHEGYGESGMAHLLEHMVFKGTPNHPKIWDALQGHGAQFNGSTWVDRTNYFETLPATAENLQFALEMEADRMVNSKVAAEDLQKEFTVVRNEFERGENNPMRVLEERMLASAYIWHNYGKSTIGSRSDIERVPIDNLREFYRRFYQPDNALLVVAGKFEPAAALDIITRTFGALPKPTRKLNSTYTVEPAQDGERSVTLRRSGDVAVVGLVYHAVSGADPDMVAAEALSDALDNKPSGRVYKGLVETGLAARVNASIYPWAEPGVFKIHAEVGGAKAHDDKAIAEVKTRLIEITEGLAKAPITEEEVKRWRTATLTDIELSLTDPGRIGVELSEWAAIGDWRMFFVHRDRVEKVTAAQVNAFAQRWLKQQNRTVGVFLPTTAPERAPEAARVDVGGLVKDYKGRAAVKEGEVFTATVENLERRIVRTALSSGMKVGLLQKRTRGENVRILVRIHAGSEQLLAGKAQDAAQLVTTMLLRGTKKRNFQQLQDELDRLKVDLRLSPDGDLGGGGMRLMTVRNNLPAVISILAEILKEPAFLAAEFETLRKETLAGLEQQLQDPQVQAMVRLQQKVQPYLPTDVRYTPSTAERIARIKALTVADVQRYWAATWGGTNGELVVVGDFEPATVKTQLETELGSWRSAMPYSHVRQTFQPNVPGTEELVKTPDKPMALVGAAHAVALRDDDPDYPTLVMMNFILGGSAKSRLLDRLRQKEGLSYGAFSQLMADSIDHLGWIGAGAICAKENADKALAALRQEIEKLRMEGVDAKELGESKKAYQSTFDNQLANDDYVASRLARLLYLGRTFDFHAKVNSAVAALLPNGVKLAAQKWIDPKRLILVRAGDLQ